MINKYFQIERKHMVTVQFIIDGYDRMATVSTIDARKAVIRVSIMPDFILDMEGLLETLKIEYAMQEIFDDQEKYPCSC